MASSIIQRSFASGELDPALHSRVDQARYATGLKTLRNAYVRKNGGADSRPGTIYIAEGKSRTKKHRHIPFQVSTSVKYQIVLGEGYIRFIKNDALITDSTKNITAITQANPGVFTSVAHGFSNGQELAIAGVLGMVQLNNQNFFVANVTANTYELTYRDGTPVDTTAFGAYISGGTASRIYEISTPYLEADLPFIHYSQSADVMNITHQSYPPAELRRVSDASWTYFYNGFQPSLSLINPWGGTATAGAVPIIYAITAISSVNGEETLPIIHDFKSITSITQAFPAVVTTSAVHGHIDNEIVRMNIPSVAGMTELDNRWFFIRVLSTTTFALVGEDSTTYTAYTAGGFANFGSQGALAAVPTVAAPAVLTWGDATGVLQYNIYKSQSGGVFGLIGIASGVSFKDEGFEPNSSIIFPFAVNPFRTAGNYPAISTYVQQRLFFANTINKPEDVWASAIGNYSNFNSQSSDNDQSLQFRLAGEEVNPVRHIFNMGSLTMLSDVAEWICSGDQDGTLTPSNINPKQQSGNGASYLKPVIIDFSAVYIQEPGEVVRDFRADLQGGDLSAFSHHLYKNKKVVSMAYQKTPNSILWMAMDDGSLVSLTYIREQQIIGFARHDFDGGFVEDVSAYRNSNEYEVFVTVRRTIDGQTRRYIERFFTRRIVDIIDNIFMDSALSYDGRNTGSTTMTLSGGTTWGTNETLTLTSSAAFFAAADVGKEIHFYNDDGVLLLRFKINAFTSSTVVTGKANYVVPVALRTTATLEWAKAVNQVSGLWHLEGETLSVVGDRTVIASPNNTATNYETCVVTDGVIDLGGFFAVVHAGLPFIVDIVTLPVDSAQGETLQNKNKLNGKVTGRFEDTAGVYIGTREPTGADLLANLFDAKIREDENYDSPNNLINGLVEFNVDSTWDKTGQVFIRQVDPLPISLVSVVSEGLFPFKGGA
jgi:hypothetical protein